MMTRATKRHNPLVLGVWTRWLIFGGFLAGLLVVVAPFWGSGTSRVYDVLPAIAQFDPLVEEKAWECIVDVSTLPEGRLVSAGSGSEADGARLYRVGFTSHSILHKGIFAPTSMVRSIDVSFEPASRDLVATPSEMEIARRVAFEHAKAIDIGLAPYITPDLISCPFPPVGGIVDRQIVPWWPGYALNVMALVMGAGAIISAVWAVRASKLADAGS